MEHQRYAVVVTTINHPTSAVLELQARSTVLPSPLYLVGDSKSPADFSLPGARYLDLDTQRFSGFRFAELCPTRHYARKNVGYLAAIQDGANVIIETDDDNIPARGFWAPRERIIKAPLAQRKGWCNVYRYFTDAMIWPRGLPLSCIADAVEDISSSPATLHDCPIQQRLADSNPDVDAIYRLILPLPLNFREEGVVVLDQGVWCPFNSQNTTFWKPAFPLLYLPFHCSFRMTDIWRSFVAQRVAWQHDWRISFQGSTVYQDRNEHDLMKDFEDEIPGYLHNDRIRRTLEDTALSGREDRMGDDMLACYRALINIGTVKAEEEPLLHAWLEDLSKLG